MQVLICDDDPSCRLVLRRLLEHHFGCGVHECANGVEALEEIERHKFAFVLLDLEMPSMDGIETLSEIRQSSATRDLPVVILSRERSEQAVMTLARLGISDYILKPPHQAVTVEKLGRLIRMLPAADLGPAPDTANLRLSTDSPALLADGNLDYRDFFTSQMERFGTVMTAESGAAAIGIFRRTPVGLVFLGSGLGVIGPDRLVAKMRATHPHRVRVIHILDASDAPVADTGLYDATIVRSYVPAVFQASILPFVSVPGPFRSLLAIVPDLKDILKSAAPQVFGMMFDTDIVTAAQSGPVDTYANAFVNIEVQGRFLIRLGIHMSEAAARDMAAKKCGKPANELTGDDCLSTCSEIATLAAGRLHARLLERGLDSKTCLPITEPAQRLEDPDQSIGGILKFLLPTGSEVFVSLHVQDHPAETSATGVPAGAAEASQVSAPASASATPPAAPEAP